MKIENIMKMLEVFWPIAIAIYGFFIYKFIPYMKTKIFINEYHNFEESFFLMEYELVGTIVAQVLVIFLIVAFGKSTWSNIIINEYFFALSVIGLIYSFGISLIVKLKTKKQTVTLNFEKVKNKKTKKEICRQYVFWNSGLLCNFNARFSNLKKFI